MKTRKTNSTRSSYRHVMSGIRFDANPLKRHIHAPDHLLNMPRHSHSTNQVLAGPFKARILHFYGLPYRIRFARGSYSLCECVL